MLYIARVRLAKYGSKSDRVLRKLKGCASLDEAWEKAKEMFPGDKIYSVQLSKRKLNEAIS